MLHKQDVCVRLLVCLSALRYRMFHGTRAFSWRCRVDTRTSTLGANTLTGIEIQTSDAQSVPGPYWAWTLGASSVAGRGRGTQGFCRHCAPRYTQVHSHMWA